jgi:RHS repeat-associated protein
VEERVHYVGDWKFLLRNIDIPSDGQIKISFEADDNYLCGAYPDGFFDNFRVQRLSPVVFQENHYDPWGLNLKGIEENDAQTQQNVGENRMQYNGKEKTEDFSLMWNDHGARNLDLQIGRWNGVDALAHKYWDFSTYTAMGNNPIKFVDLNGKNIDDVFLDREGNEIGRVENNNPDRLFVMKTNKKSFTSDKKIPAAASALKKDDASAQITSGNVDYDDFVEIQSSKEVRQKMFDIVSQDASDNSIEYGGVVDADDGAVYESTGIGENSTGTANNIEYSKAKNPSEQTAINTVLNDPEFTFDLFHSHPSNEKYNQVPSEKDRLTSQDGNMRLSYTFAFGKSEQGGQTVYIQDKTGIIQATMPINKFVNPGLKK